ncbi:MAG TPA: TIGR03435 family protein [Acidobacteriaceae bacterium]
MSLGVIPLLVAAGLMVLPVSSRGQTGAATAAASALPADAPYVPTMTFDVASVRQNKSDLLGGYTMGGWFVPGTAILRMMNISVENLISNAYGVHQAQIVGIPKWPWPTVFMVEAKGDSAANEKMATLTKVQQRAEQKHMLQALLEDRFKLKTDWETREGDVYNLVVAKGGPKMGAEGSMPPTADELKNFGAHPVPPLLQKSDGQGYDFIAHGCSMSWLAEMMTGQFGRPVIDKTGLTGKYDFVLKYKGRWDRDRQADDLDPLPPLDRALQEELGLKVETAKGPVKFLVIDHVEMPSAN